MNHQELSLPQISTQARLLVTPEVQTQLAWSDHEYQTLVTGLFQQTPWHDAGRDSLYLNVTLSLHTEGRSAVTVLKLAFLDANRRAYTLIIRSHPTAEGAQRERENAKRINVNARDDFLNLVEVPVILANRHLVIYEDVAFNRAGDSVVSLCQSLPDYFASHAGQKTFASNLKEFIRRVTTVYEKLENRYETLDSQRYGQSLQEDLPPDLVIHSAYLYESATLVVQPAGPDRPPQEIPTVPLVNLWHSRRETKSEATAIAWVTIQEKYIFTGPTALRIGASKTTAYLAWTLSVAQQSLVIWLGVDKNQVEELQTKLFSGHTYTVVARAGEIVTFTSWLHQLGFEEAGGLATTDFLAWCDKLQLGLPCNLRHTDYHCGNVLVAKGSFKVIDVEDMHKDLIACDLARLETSLWFEVTHEKVSAVEANQVLSLLAKEEKPSEKGSAPWFTVWLILNSLRQGFYEGVLYKEFLTSQQVELAYVTQILFYQRYCLLDGMETIHPAFSVFASHWLNRLQQRTLSLRL